MRIFIRDGAAHKRYGGYGAVARGLIRQLALRPDCEVFLEAGGEWVANEEGNNWAEFRALADRLPKFNADWGTIDMVLRIGSPGSSVRFPKPCLWYTGNGLSALTPEFVEILSSADAFVVSSEVDRLAFQRHFRHVFYAGQAAEPRTYSPVESYRKEGREQFTFYFVGSFSYRKGVDLLIRAFLEEFTADEAHLSLYCIGGNTDWVISYLLNAVGQQEKKVSVELLGQDRSEAWMNRGINRADCFVSLSRGESWCLPVCEAGLAGKAIIAPNSTAMGEYLTEEVAFLVKARAMPCSQIDDPFGRTMREKYGINGVAHFEPDLADARRVMRGVWQDRSELDRRAANARSYFLNTQNWDKVGRELHSAIRDFAMVAGIGSGMTEPVGAA